ncbi:MAG: adenosine kinase [Gemmatimonadetes bacterium]|nr:adenosine kinase [Gemmatimonadota bacterium]
MAQKYNVYGVGNALVDVQYQVSDAYIERMNVEMATMTLVDEARQTELIENVENEPLERASGGSAANTVIGVVGFGGTAYYGCKVGTDEPGEFYLSDLTAAGVGSNPNNRVDGVTGECVVLIGPDGERSLNTFLGITSEFSPNEIEADVAADSDVVYIEGYLLSADAGFAAALKAQELGKEKGAKVALTLSDVFIVNAFKERVDELFRNGIDLLFGNEAEAVAYTDRSDVSGACLVLGKVVKDFAITLGSEGALVTDSGNVKAVDGFPVDAVDTNGAGDAFAGAFLYGITNGHSPEEAGRLGCYAGSKVVSKFGPRLGADYSGQVREILGG